MTDSVTGKPLASLLQAAVPFLYFFGYKGCFLNLIMVYVNHMFEML